MHTGRRHENSRSKSVHSCTRTHTDGIFARDSQDFAHARRVHWRERRLGCGRGAGGSVLRTRSDRMCEMASVVYNVMLMYWLVGHGNVPHAVKSRA